MPDRGTRLRLLGKVSSICKRRAQGSRSARKVPKKSVERTVAERGLSLGLVFTALLLYPVLYDAAAYQELPSYGVSPTDHILG
jgi:hypothetical protein